MSARPADFIPTHKNVELFQKDYILDTNVFGAGAFGRVQLCQKRGSKETRVVKIISKTGMEE